MNVVCLFHPVQLNMLIWHGLFLGFWKTTISFVDISSFVCSMSVFVGENCRYFSKETFDALHFFLKKPKFSLFLFFLLLLQYTVGVWGFLQPSYINHEVGVQWMIGTSWKGSCEDPKSPMGSRTNQIPYTGIKCLQYPTQNQIWGQPPRKVLTRYGGHSIYRPEPTTNALWVGLT